MRSDLEKFERDDGKRRLLRQETLIVDVLEEVNRVLSSEEITKTALAERMGKTKGFVSQILSGKRNLTLRTIADVCSAIGHTPHFELQRESRTLVALPSVTNRVCAVDWMDDNVEFEFKGTATFSRDSGADASGNQELGLVA